MGGDTALAGSGCDVATGADVDASGAGSDFFASACFAFPRALGVVALPFAFAVFDLGVGVTAVEAGAGDFVGVSEPFFARISAAILAAIADARDFLESALADGVGVLGTAGALALPLELGLAFFSDESFAPTTADEVDASVVLGSEGSETAGVFFVCLGVVFSG